MRLKLMKLKLRLSSLGELRVRLKLMKLKLSIGELRVRLKLVKLKLVRLSFKML